MANIHIIEEQVLRVESRGIVEAIRLLQGDGSVLDVAITNRNGTVGIFLNNLGNTRAWSLRT